MSALSPVVVGGVSGRVPSLSCHKALVQVKSRVTVTSLAESLVDFDISDYLLTNLKSSQTRVVVTRAG